MSEELSNLEPFMFYKDRIEIKTDVKKEKDTKEKDTKEKDTKEKDTKEKEYKIIPTGMDSLFWCFYIMVNGYSKYASLYSRNDVAERTIKIQYVEKLRKHKDILKNYKLSISHVENKLANERVIDADTFISLCAIEKINVYLIRKKVYYKFSIDFDTEHYFVLKYDENKNLYYIDQSYNYSSIENDYYKIENIHKPFNTITSYKVEELIDIADRLKLTVINQEKPEKKPTKKDYYELILQTLSG